MVSKISILPISDGYHIYTEPRELLFPKVSAENIKNIPARSNDWKEWKSPYTPTLITDGAQKILVDTGAGKLVPTAGQLHNNLKKEGVTHEDIDTVIITHLHPDHIAGLLIDDSKMIFPNANLLLSEVELNYWSSNPKLDEINIPHEIKKMIRTTAEQFLTRYSSKIKAVPMDFKITPNIKLFAAPGHTPGHIGVEVNDGNKSTLIVGDAFLHPLHIANPGWTASVDIIPETTIRTRRQIIKRLRNEACSMLGFHLPVSI
ncbi:MBL fold metallo-hydrolase [Maridesulfovibrio bastinii]|uniref:MBL fold metallo-hydrolase n=1 Tax=Maridesulfovibrio bastinii TaxID=47157 RepID=UPI00040556B3|nr:MBL fold metallo-hydrolase [Maridesulfovibrio bastinii]